MTDTIVILDPVAPTEAGKSAHPPRALNTLQGRVVGFIDNSKPNFNFLADDLAALLLSRYGVAGVVRHRKLTAASPAPSGTIADIKQRCDLVLVGSAD
ncbi:MAG: hypothetical protein HYY78_16530 [Betaproteobacteria bacterium]|nr:hypothetical protein [Betaproteobacteria bacterium]